MRAAFQPRYVPLRWDKQRKQVNAAHSLAGRAHAAEPKEIRCPRGCIRWSKADAKLLRSFYASAPLCYNKT
jgi:hypothetical protein